MLMEIVLPGFEIFNGKWKNSGGQKFSVRNGVIWMDGVEQSRIVVKANDFYLGESSWAMKRTSKSFIWQQAGHENVQWFRISNDDHSTKTASETIQNVKFPPPPMPKRALPPGFKGAVTGADGSAPKKPSSTSSAVTFPPPPAMPGFAKKTSDPKWACSQCTFLNDSLHLSCTICGTQKQSEKKDLQLAQKLQNEEHGSRKGKRSSNETDLPPQKRSKPNEDKQISKEKQKNSQTKKYMCPECFEEFSGWKKCLNHMQQWNHCMDEITNAPSKRKKKKKRKELQERCSLKEQAKKSVKEPVEEEKPKKNEKRKLSDVSGVGEKPKKRVKFVDPSEKKKVAEKKQVHFVDLTETRTHEDFRLAQTVEVLVQGRWTSGRVISKGLEKMTVEIHLPTKKMTRSYLYDSIAIRDSAFKMPVKKEKKPVKKEPPKKPPLPKMPPTSNNPYMILKPSAVNESFPKPRLPKPRLPKPSVDKAFPKPPKHDPLMALYPPYQVSNTKPEAFPKPRPFVSVARPAAVSNSLAVQKAHIIFVIDNSGSMRKKDVKSKEKITRSGAAFECIKTFVNNQLRDAIAGADLYSLVIFEDEAWSEFVGLPIDQSVLRQIEEVRKKTIPKFGTGIDSGLKTAFEVAGKINSNNKITNTIVVLLSDGAPRNPKYIAITEKAIKRDKSIQLHTVGIGECNHKKLKTLAKLGGGEYYQSALDLKLMRQVFTQIATTLTTMRTDAVRANRQSLNLRLENPGDYLRHRNSGWITYDASLMCQKQLRFLGAETRIRIRKKPFGAGQLRYAYILEALDGTNDVFVAKESKFEERYEHRLKYHKDNVLQQSQARKWARKFNFAVANAGKHFRTKFVKAAIMRVRDTGSKGGFRYLQAEEKVSGTFTKYNSNAGVIPSSADACEYGQIANAFSHFTYESSNEEEIVLDIQGSELTWTDPQIISREKMYGDADLGPKAMKNFFTYHTCGELCQSLGLKNRAPGAVLKMPSLEMETKLRQQKGLK